VKQLTFRLDVEDGWPPVAAEGIPCVEEPAGLRVTVPPLFIKGLAVGDNIEVLEESEGQVVAWKTTKTAGHSTIWVMPNKHDIETELEELRGLGCNTSVFPGGVLYAVDLPPNLAPSEVDKRFESLTPQVALAHPAWRHED
jgi:hypothetical protein